MVGEVVEKEFGDEVGEEKGEGFVVKVVGVVGKVLWVYEVWEEKLGVCWD